MGTVTVPALHGTVCSRRGAQQGGTGPLTLAWGTWKVAKAEAQEGLRAWRPWAVGGICPTCQPSPGPTSPASLMAQAEGHTPLGGAPSR